MRLPTLQLALRPGILELRWGHPDPALLPASALARAAARTLADQPGDSLGYGHPAGPGALLEWLMARLGQTDGRAPAPDEILITGGISLGLELVLAACAGPGDVVLVESPTYHLAPRIMRDRALQLVAVPADEQGLNVTALAEIAHALRRAGRVARALYLVPTFNNPTGRTLSGERRAALVSLAAEEGLLIIEDDVYRELAYDAPAAPSLWSLAPPGAVARLGAFSKTLAPGLRLGWLTAGRGLVTRLVEGGLLDSGGGINHFTAMVVGALCTAGDFDPHVASLRTALRERRDALLAALDQHLPPGCVVERPGGGFFVWVQLPPGLDSAALLRQAEASGVSYLPGATFHTDPRGAGALRLAFSLYPPPALAEAARRLGAALGI
jgi:DNA-binding transcriptional MocR family regulator